MTAPKDEDVFTITLNINGTIIGTTDCNNFNGRYIISSDNKLSFENGFASTKKGCQESQEYLFMNSLEQVERYSINDEGNLALQLKSGLGTMIFKQ
ncbi:MAG: META domain-containing protein [bacterium]|nr:META domain-containing protein [bacterium]